MQIRFNQISPIFRVLELCTKYLIKLYICQSLDLICVLLARPNQISGIKFNIFCLVAWLARKTMLIKAFYWFLSFASEKRLEFCSVVPFGVVRLFNLRSNTTRSTHTHTRAGSKSMPPPFRCFPIGYSNKNSSSLEVPRHQKPKTANRKKNTFDTANVICKREERP